MHQLELFCACFCVFNVGPERVWLMISTPKPKIVILLLCTISVSVYMILLVVKKNLHSELLSF